MRTEWITLASLLTVAGVAQAGLIATSTTITTTSPAAPQVGNGIHVYVDVDGLTAGATGTVLVSGGGVDCEINLPFNFCVIVPSTVGELPLVAEYFGDDAFAGSQSDTVLVEVMPATLPQLGSLGRGIGPAGAGADSLDVSGNGQHVVFASRSPYFHPADQGQDVDIFHVDRFSTALTMISVDNAGERIGGDNPSISANGERVVFVTRNAVDGLGAGVEKIVLRDLTTQQTRIVSVTSDGQLANGDSKAPVISADGRFVAFESSATNLVTEDDAVDVDIYVVDLMTDSIELVSRTTAGAPASGNSSSPSISADGSFVAFASFAENLDPTAGTRRNIYRHNRGTKETIRVSISFLNEPPSRDSGFPSISGDGRRIVFESAANNLIPGDIYNYTDVFLYDADTGLVSRLSTAPGGTAWGGSFDPAISQDGTTVVFESLAWNLVDVDSNGTRDVFSINLDDLIIHRASVGTNGIESNGESSSSRISADGSLVAFLSTSGNLALGDSNQRDAFLRAPAIDSTLLISRARLELGNQGNGPAYSFELLENEGSVLFLSYASNLVEGDDDSSDLFVRDVASGQIHQLSVNQDGVSANEDVHELATSADGLIVAFATSASNLVIGDTNGRPDVFLLDRESESLRRISVLPDGSQGTGAKSPALSGDGGHVALVSRDNLVEGMVGMFSDQVFMLDIHNESMQLISKSVDSEPADRMAHAPDVSQTGRYVVYESAASNLPGPPVPTGMLNIYRYDRISDTTIRISLGIDGSATDGPSAHPTISRTGRFVAFSSSATNLVSPPPTANGHIYVRDIDYAVTHLVTGSGNDGSLHPNLSDSGRFVIFGSSATNLIPGVVTEPGVFGADLETGEITRIGGGGAYTNLHFPKISSSGALAGYLSQQHLGWPYRDNDVPDLILERPSWVDLISLGGFE